MAEGWVLVAGIAAFFLTVSLAAVLLRATGGSRGGRDGLLALGPTLVVLGIIFGDDPLVGYTFIGAGVILSIVIAVQRPTAAA